VCNKRTALEPIKIHTPSGTVLQSTHEADLDLPGLPLAARHGHIVPQLATQPLLSIGQLCDAGCDVAFTADRVTIKHNDKVILQGHRTASTKLWELDIQPTTHKANAAVGSATPAELVAFAHAALFSPALSTLAEALRRGHLPEFAGLTLQRLRQYPPQSIAMMQGHMDQERQHKKSTKPKKELPGDDDAFPLAPVDGARIHFCYAAMLEPTGQIYTDQT